MSLTVLEVRSLPDYEAGAVLIKAIAEPIRLQILDILSSGEMCACDILENLTITQPTLSHHMKALTASGWVTVRKKATWMYYCINHEAIEQMHRYMLTLTTEMNRIRSENDSMNPDKNEKRKLIMKNYAAVAVNQGSNGCCGSDCSCSGTIDAKDAARALGYSDEDLNAVPDAANMGLGCGNPLAIAALKPGEIVLDLGSGGGFDCFLARRQVGPEGLVIGVDMTPDMIMLARQNAQKAGYANVSFRLGEIEHLPVADNTVDVIISNCVINLALEKEQVFRDAWRVLKTGGRLSISDIVATAELPEQIKDDLAMLSGCIAGAEYVENLRVMLENTGFRNINLVPKDNSREILKSWVPESNVEDYVASYMIEAIK